MNKENALLLQNIFETCRQIGLVETQYQFSELCGRQTSWFSANKSRDLPLSISAAYILSVRLRDAAQQDIPYKLRRHAKTMSELLIAMISDRARKQREGL